MNDLLESCTHFLMEGCGQTRLANSQDHHDIETYKDHNPLRYNLYKHGYIKHWIKGGLVHWDYTAKGIKLVRDSMSDLLNDQIANAAKTPPTGVITSIIELFDVLSRHGYDGSIVLYKPDHADSIFRYSGFYAEYRYFPTANNKSRYYVIDPMVMWVDKQRGILWKNEHADDLMIQHKTFNMIRQPAYCDSYAFNAFLRESSTVDAIFWEDVRYQYYIDPFNAEVQHKSMRTIHANTVIGEC